MIKPGSITLGVILGIIVGGIVVLGIAEQTGCIGSRQATLARETVVTVTVDRNSGELAIAAKNRIIDELAGFGYIIVGADRPADVTVEVGQSGGTHPFVIIVAVGCDGKELLRRVKRKEGDDSIERFPRDLSRSLDNWRRARREG